jgi:hypothetical protein
MESVGVTSLTILQVIHQLYYPHTSCLCSVHTMNFSFFTLVATFLLATCLALPRGPEEVSLASPLLQKRASRGCGEWKMKCKNAAAACNSACYLINCIIKPKGLPNRYVIIHIFQEHMCLSRINNAKHTNFMFTIGFPTSRTEVPLTGCIPAAPFNSLLFAIALLSVSPCGINRLSKQTKWIATNFPWPPSSNHHMWRVNTETHCGACPRAKMLVSCHSRHD